MHTCVYFYDFCRILVWYFFTWVHLLLQYQYFCLNKEAENFFHHCQSHHVTLLVTDIRYVSMCSLSFGFCVICKTWEEKYLKKNLYVLERVFWEYINNNWKPMWIYIFMPSTFNNRQSFKWLDTLTYTDDEMLQLLFLSSLSLEWQTWKKGGLIFNYRDWWVTFLFS